MKNKYIWIIVVIVVLVISYFIYNYYYNNKIQSVQSVTVKPPRTAVVANLPLLTTTVDSSGRIIRVSNI